MALAIGALPAIAYPNNLACGTPLTVGTSMMGQPAASSSSTSASFYGKSCGGIYTAGEALRVAFTGRGRAVLELSGGAVFSGNGGSDKCSGRRYHSSSSGLTDIVSIDTSAASGPISIWAGYASGYGTVTITQSCTLDVSGPPLPPSPPSPPPTLEPSPVVPPPAVPPPPPPPPRSMSALFWVHGLLMGFAWLVLAPLGVQISRFGRRHEALSAPLVPDGAPKRKARWYVWHRAIQMSASLLMAVALILVIAAVGAEGIDHNRNLHGQLGSLTLVMLLGQIIGAVWRPKHGARYRRAWELGHKACGYGMWTLAIVTCLLGSLRMDDIRSRYSEEPVVGNTWIVVLVAAVTSGASIVMLELLVWRARGAAPPEGAYSKNLDNRKVQTAAAPQPQIPATPKTAQATMAAPPAGAQRPAVAPQPPAQEESPAVALTVDGAGVVADRLREESAALRRSMGDAVAKEDYQEAARLKRQVSQVEARQKMNEAVAAEDYVAAAAFKQQAEELQST